MTAATSTRDRPLIRVIAVTYSSGDVLERFLHSLEKATLAAYEVVLVDNGSDDDAVDRAASSMQNVRAIHAGRNLGYGGAANLGARDADPQWLVVANPDVVWSDGALDELLAATGRWPAAGAFGPAIRTPDGALYPSARALPSLGRGIGHALVGWWWPSNPWTAEYRREREGPTEGPVGWLSGSCLVLRADAFNAVGGFDPAYFMFFEDLDLCERLGNAGWQCVYVPSAVVTHIGGHATRRAPVRMQAAHHRSAYRYLSRRYAGWRWLPLRVALAFGLSARYLLSLMVRRVAEGARPTRSADALRHE